MKTIDFIETLPIGDNADGEKYTVLPFQRRFIENSLAPGIQRAALTVARGNGKSGICSALILCMILPEGPLHEKNIDVACFAASFGQARIISDSVVGSLRELKREGEFKISNSDNQVRIVHKETNARFRAYASNSRTSHGGRWKYVFCDEGAQWEEASGARLWSAITTTMGKRKNSKIFAIGTKPVDGSHWFSRLLNDKSKRTYSQIHDSDSAKDDWKDPKTWAKANPALDILVSQEILWEECERAKSDPQERASFKAYRANMGTLDVDEENLLLNPEDWLKIEGPTDPEGPYICGLDLGGGVSFTAAVAVFENGDLDIVQAIGDDPPLAEREKTDDVPRGTYQRMETEEELVILGTNAVPIIEFLEHIEDKWGIPKAIVADRHKRNELLADIKKVGWYGKVRMIFRSATFEQSTEDLALFRRAVLDKEIQAPKSWAIVNALAGARVKRNDELKEKLAKKGSGRRHRHKDDLVAAGILGIAEHMRRKHFKVEVSHPIEIASTAIPPEETPPPELEIAGF